MSDKPSGVRTRADAKAEQGGDAGASGAAPDRVELKGGHRAGFASKSLLARHAPADVYVAGQTHPQVLLAAGHAMHHEDCAERCGLRPADDASAFDLETYARTFDAPANGADDYDIIFPRTLQLPCGDSFTITSVADFFRFCHKYDADAGCCCAPTGRFEKPAYCTKCQLRVRPLVQRAYGDAASLVDAGYVTGHSDALVDLLLTLALRELKPGAEGELRRSRLPEHFSPGRPSDATGARTSVSQREEGFPPGHEFEGWRGVVRLVCDFPAPSGGVCGCEMVFAWRDSMPDRLRVLLAAGMHRHAAATCATKLGSRCTSGCVGWHRTPLALPGGRMNSLYAATRLRDGTDSLAAVDAGNSDRVEAVRYAVTHLVPPAAVVHRNLSFTGTARSLEEAFALERARKLLRQGVTPPTPEEQGGPTTHKYKVMEQLEELALRKANPDPEKRHLGPVLEMTVFPHLLIILTTPQRIKALARLSQAPREYSTALHLDATSNIIKDMGDKFLHVVLAFSLPASAGGGRVGAVTMITNSGKESAIMKLLEAVRQSLRKLDAKFLPPSLSTDQDLATCNAVCRVLNGCTFAEHCNRLVALLLKLADTLAERGLLGAPLDPDVALPHGLPIAGFELGDDGEYVPLLEEGMTLNLLCVAHYIKTAIDHIMLRGVLFKPLPAAERGFWLTIHLNFLYPAVSSPLFAGTHLFLLLKCYLEEVHDVLSLGPVLAVGAVYEGVVVFAHVRATTPADADADADATPLHRFKLEVFIRGLERPIVTVRIRAALGDDDAGFEAERVPEVEALQRQAQLAGLPGDAAAYKDVATDALCEQESYEADEPPAAPEDSGEGAALAPPAPAAQDSAPPSSAATGDGAARDGAARDGAARASGSATPATLVTNPIWLEITVKGKLEYPMQDAWQLRAQAAVLAGPTFRTSLRQLLQSNNTANPVEMVHHDSKHLYHSKEQLPMPLLAGVSSLISAMERQDAADCTRVARCTDIVTPHAVRAMSNGARGAGGASGKQAKASGAADQGGGKGKGKAKAKAQAKAKARELPTEGLLEVRAAADIDPSTVWGAPRGAPVVPAGARGVAAVVDAPEGGSIMALLRAQRHSIKPAAEAMEGAQLQAVPLTVETLRRQQLGAKVAATALRKTEEAAVEVMKAKEQLAKRLQTFALRAREAQDRATEAARSAGAVDAAVAAPQPLGRHNAPPSRAPRSASAAPALRGSH